MPPANAAQLAAALRQGGLVLFVRHAATDRSRDDDAHVVLENCATQRNLSAAGRAQAEGIAAAVKRLHLPIGAVRASPYCRTAETARLAFGYMLLDNDLLPAGSINAKQHLAAVRRQLGTPPLPGHDSVLVGHGDTIKALLGLELEEGETLVVRPAPERRIVRARRPHSRRTVAGAGASGVTKDKGTKDEGSRPRRCDDLRPSSLRPLSQPKGPQ